MKKLLGREDFKNEVFKRDNYKCVVPNCGQDAVDAHHILDRKLFSDGGYYINNGASLCATHHLDAEIGKFTVKEILDYCNINLDIDEVPIPIKFNDVVDYINLLKTDSIDKWGEKRTVIDSINEWWKKYKK